MLLVVQVTTWTLPPIHFSFHPESITESRDTQAKRKDPGTALACRSCCFGFIGSIPRLYHFITCTLTKWSLKKEPCSLVCNSSDTFVQCLHQDTSRRLSLSRLLNSDFQIIPKICRRSLISFLIRLDHWDKRRWYSKGCHNALRTALIHNLQVSKNICFTFFPKIEADAKASIDFFRTFSFQRAVDHDSTPSCFNASLSILPDVPSPKG